MIDERMTQGDVRLLDVPCPECGHATMSHDYDAICWTGDCQCEMSRTEVSQRNHERIVAARVGEVVERVEAVLRAHQPGAHQTAWMHTAIRAALRAADAPLSDQERDGGHGGAGGDAGAGEGQASVYERNQATLKEFIADPLGREEKR